MASHYDSLVTDMRHRIAATIARMRAEGILTASPTCVRQNLDMNAGNSIPYGHSPATLTRAFDDALEGLPPAARRFVQ